MASVATITSKLSRGIFILIQKNGLRSITNAYKNEFGPDSLPFNFHTSWTAFCNSLSRAFQSHAASNLPRQPCESPATDGRHSSLLPVCISPQGLKTWRLIPRCHCCQTFEMTLTHLLITQDWETRGTPRLFSQQKQPKLQGCMWTKTFEKEQSDWLMITMDIFDVAICGQSQQDRASSELIYLMVTEIWTSFLKSWWYLGMMLVCLYVTNSATGINFVFF